MPFVFFMCNHAIHEDCLGGSEENDCPNCAEKRTILEERIYQANAAGKEHGSFALELQSKQKKFNLISKQCQK